MNAVMPEYDTFFIRVRDFAMALFVRSDRRALLQARLAALGFVKTRERPFDFATFSKEYEAQTINVFPC